MLDVLANISVITFERKNRKSKVQDHPWLHSDFDARMDKNK